MKKLFVLALVFVLMIPSCLAEIDFTSLSMDELMNLRKNVEDEIHARLGGSDAIYVGDYLAGKDIKPGKYVITCTEETPTAGDDMVFGIYNSDDSYESHKSEEAYFGFRSNAVLFFQLQKDGVATVTLEEGQHLIIKWGKGTCEPFAPSWAP